MSNILKNVRSSNSLGRAPKKNAWDFHPARQTNIMDLIISKIENMINVISCFNAKLSINLDGVVYDNVSVRHENTIIYFIKDDVVFDYFDLGFITDKMIIQHTDKRKSLYTHYALQERFNTLSLSCYLRGAGRILKLILSDFKEVKSFSDNVHMVMYKVLNTQRLSIHDGIDKQKQFDKKYSINARILREFVIDSYNANSIGGVNNKSIIDSINFYLYSQYKTNVNNNSRYIDINCNKKTYDGKAYWTSNINPHTFDGYAMFADSFISDAYDEIE